MALAQSGLGPMWPKLGLGVQTQRHPPQRREMMFPDHIRWKAQGEGQAQVGGAQRQVTKGGAGEGGAAMEEVAWGLG